MRQNRLIGRQVAGRFTIKRFLGEGGMATVFLAEQEGEPREVALKIMNEELNADRNFVKRFQREAKAAARVQHPNSVTFIDYGVADGISYIAMELLRGDDLYGVLERDGAISQLRAARILVEVCDALSVAHELGIVHRDLKPENIMVIADPAHPNGERVKVLDFGIAKLLGPEATAPPAADPDREPPSGETRAGTFIGTPSYMSPEQCGLRPVDTRADIYTCGVLLFQLVTGRLPFEGQTPLHTANLHIHEAPPRPSTFAPSLDPRIEAVILKALAKKPADRHQTARHMASMLRKILPDLPDARVALAGKPTAPLRPSGRTRNMSVLEGADPDAPPDAAGNREGGSRLQSAARIRPAAGGLPAPAGDDDGAVSRMPYDSDRTLVRPPAEDEAAPRNRELTEVMDPTADAPVAEPQWRGPDPVTVKPPVPTAPRSPLLGPPSPLSPAAANKLPPRPPPRTYKPTLKSAGGGGLAPAVRPPGSPGLPSRTSPPEAPGVPEAPQPPAPPSTLIGMAAPRPPPADGPLEGAPVVSVGGPAALGALHLGSAQLTTAQPGRPPPPAEPAAPDSIDPPTPAGGMAFDETTKMEAPELPPPGAFIPTAQTVPLIPPDLVASVLARGPPRPAAGAPAVAPAPAPAMLPMPAPVFGGPPQGPMGPQVTMPSASQAFVPPANQGYGPPPSVQGYAPSPPMQGYAPMATPMANQGPALAPQTPPVFPVAAAPVGGARISSARGLLLGFLAGAVLMAIVATAYFLTH